MNQIDNILKIKLYTIVLFLFFSMFTIGLFLYQHFLKEGGFFFVNQKTYIDIPKEKIKKVVLDNGLTLLIYENHSVPKVLVQIAYDIGAAVEGAGERGLAHLIEHMIFKGTEKLSEGDIDSVSRKYGASFNAFTSYDETSYYFEVNKNNWKPFLVILSDCMQNARFDKEHLASELKAVIAELRMNKDDYWRYTLEKAKENCFPPNHQYHFPIIGFKEDLASLKAEDLKTFYKKYYQPERATLFIVGDINPDEAIKLVKENFEHIANKSKTNKASFPTIIPDVISSKNVVYRDITAPQVAFYWMIPGNKSDLKIYSESAELILGQGEGSRLFSRLVDEEKVATDVSASAINLYDAGVFMIFVQPKEGQISKCKALIEEEMNKFIKEGPKTKELIKLSKLKRRQFFNLLENNQKFTYRWIKSFFATKNEYDVFEYMNKFVDVSSQEIAYFAKEYLDPLFMSEVQILPVPESKKEMILKARQEEDLLDEKILASHKRTTPKEAEKYVKKLQAPEKLEFEFPKPDLIFNLNNGLRVLLKRRDFSPTVGVNIYFRDAQYFSSAKEGILVGLMMDLLMEYSKGFTKKENLSFFENEGALAVFGANGGGINSLAENFDKVFKHFFHVLTNPIFRQEDLDKLKAVAIDDFERAKNEPKQVGIRILKNLVYPNHPFNWSFEEAIEILEKVELKDIEDLHKKYVSPSSMVLSIAGDFDLEHMQNFIERVLNSWSGTSYKSAFVPKEKPELIIKNIDYYMLRDQAILVLGRPSSINLYNPDIVPLKLLTFIVLYSLGSRLFNLREETGLFYMAAGSWAANATKEHGFDYVFTILNVSAIEAAEKKLKEMFDELASKGIMQNELEVGRALYLKELIDLCDSNQDLASQFGILDVTGLGFDYYDKVLNRLNNMTVQEVNEIAKKYCSSENLSRIRVGRIGRK